jgi:hypothetical protein
MKKTDFLVSLLLNALFIFLFILAGFIKTSTLSFYNMDKAEGKDATFISAAALVSAPLDSEVVFNPIEIKLKRGEKAALQFSVVMEKNQANRLFEILYDRDIIDVAKTGYGFVITALKAGEVSIQTLTEYGIRDIAVIYVGN